MMYEWHKNDIKRKNDVPYNPTHWHTLAIVTWLDISTCTGYEDWINWLWLKKRCILCTVLFNSVYSWWGNEGHAWAVVLSGGQGGAKRCGSARDSLFFVLERPTCYCFSLVLFWCFSGLCCFLVFSGFSWMYLYFSSVLFLSSFL